MTKTDKDRHLYVTYTYIYTYIYKALPSLFSLAQWSIIDSDV